MLITLCELSFWHLACKCIFSRTEVLLYLNRKYAFVPRLNIYRKIPVHRKTLSVVLYSDGIPNWSQYIKNDSFSPSLCFDLNLQCFFFLCVFMYVFIYQQTHLKCINSLQIQQTGQWFHVEAWIRLGLGYQGAIRPPAVFLIQTHLDVWLGTNQGELLLLSWKGISQIQPHTPSSFRVFLGFSFRWKRTVHE